MADNENTYNIISLKFEEAERPDFKLTYGLDYIKFGKDNNYPSYINKLYQQSSKHQSIINGKCTYIYGKGLVSKSDSIQANQFIDKYKVLIKKLSFDIRNNGGCYIYVTPKKGGAGYYFTHIPYSRVRSNEDNTTFYYSTDFGKKRDAKPIVIPSFIYGVKKPSIIMYREYNGTNEDAYPLPDWFAALNWIDSDIEVSKHTYTNAKTGFSASKFINFYNGKPTEEQKRNVTKQFKADHGGSAGEKVVIAFNDNDAKAPTIDDLGTSDLSKEDFQHVNDLISENIYAGHGITTPQLFGVPQKEGLGGDGAKLKIGYTIFNNTYVTAKQQELQDIFTMLAQLNGVNDEFTFVQLDPIGLDITVKDVVNSLPKQFVFESLGVPKEMWELENIGVDNKPTPTLPIKPSNEVAAVTPIQQEVNNVLTNLTGRQRQNVMGIVKKFGQGKLTEKQAVILLKKGYGFTDEDVNDFLGITDASTVVMSQAFSDSEEDLFLVFAQFGEHKEDYTPVITKSAMIEVKQMFDAAEKEVGLLSKVTEVKKALPKFEVRYSYEKRSDVSGAVLLPTSRPFCIKMIENNKYYSREDIQKISSVLGYDVFNRAGGFWNNHGKTEIHCRHEFQSHVVIRKK